MFMHLVYSFHSGISALVWKDLLDFLMGEKLLAALMLVTSFCLFKCYKFSKYIFPAFTLIVAFRSGVLFFEGFDKVLLLLTFLYILCAFYFYQLLILEFEEALYNPNYTKRDLCVNGKLQNVKILVDGQMVDGQITNLDKGSLFIKFDNPVQIISKKIRVEVEYLGRLFQILGLTMTSYSDGIGLRIENGENTANNDLGWNELYDILKDRGIIRN